MADNPFPPGAAVAAYLRDSGGDDQDLSVDQQEAEIRAWCQARSLQLLNVFPDKARPGSSTVGREQFHQMLEHFRNGAQEAGLVIWRSNRLGRNVNDSQFHKADLRRRGFIVHSLMDDIPEGPAGQLVEFVLDWKDQLFLEQLSEDVKRGLHSNLIKFGVIPGQPPRGFRREKVVLGQRRDGTAHIGYKWVPDETQTSLVLKAFQMRAERITLKAIQAEVPLYKTKNCWATFFDNELYTGVLHFGETTIPDYCPPIVPAEIWQAVQAMRKVKQVSHPRREGGNVLLSGMAQCQHCGHPLNWHSINGYNYYICTYRKRTGLCDARHIPAQVLDVEIIRLAMEHILNPDNARAIRDRMLEQTPLHLDAYKQTLRNAQTEHTRLKKEISNTVAAIGVYGHSPALLASLKNLEEEESRIRVKVEELTEILNTPIEATETDLDAYIEKQRAALQDPNTARTALRQMITTIRVKRTETQIIIQLEYIPPHIQARQGRAIRSMNGVPVGAQTIDLISTINIRSRKRPSP
jgi:DNA invertase Pin-like site-specific DNA recombinase